MKKHSENMYAVAKSMTGTKRPFSGTVGVDDSIEKLKNKGNMFCALMLQQRRESNTWGESLAQGMMSRISSLLQSRTGERPSFSGVKGNSLLFENQWLKDRFLDIVKDTRMKEIEEKIASL